MTGKRTLLGLLVYLMIIMASCGGGRSSRVKEDPDTTAATETVSLSIEGMTCTGCENTICSSIGKIEGVKSVTASHVDGKAVIEYEQGKVDTMALKGAVEDAGYKALRVMPSTTVLNE